MKTKTIAVVLLATSLLAMSCKKKSAKPSEPTPEEIHQQVTDQTKSKLFGKTLIVLMTVDILQGGAVTRQGNQVVDSLIVDANGSYKLVRTPYKLAVNDTLLEYYNGNKFTGKNFGTVIYSEQKTNYTGNISVDGSNITISTYGYVVTLSNDQTNIATMYNSALKQNDAFVYYTTFNGFKTTHVQPLAIR